MVPDIRVFISECVYHLQSQSGHETEKMPSGMPVLQRTTIIPDTHRATRVRFKGRLADEEIRLELSLA
jgi:hypothetical protein